MTVSQSQFAQAVLDPAQNTPDGLSDGAMHPAGRRFDVYRNNVAVSLSEALDTGFPVIAKLLGQENMTGLAGMYLRAHPPSSPLMAQYGAEFPVFLASLPQLSHLGYLADVARLELALRRSYHAADAEPIRPDDLAATDPETLMQATIELAPAVEVVRSDWPVFDIWRFNTQDNTPKPAAARQDIIVTRPEFDPAPHLMPPGGAALTLALKDGATVETAIAAASSEYEHFDLSSSLTILLQGNAIISLNTKDTKS